jgi:hypothetical protein
MSFMSNSAHALSIALAHASKRLWFYTKRFTVGLVIRKIRSL